MRTLLFRAIAVTAVLSFRPSHGILQAGWVHPVLRK